MLLWRSKPAIVLKSSASRRIPCHVALGRKAIPPDRGRQSASDGKGRIVADAAFCTLLAQLSCSRFATAFHRSDFQIGSGCSSVSPFPGAEQADNAKAASEERKSCGEWRGGRSLAGYQLQLDHHVVEI